MGDVILYKLYKKEGNGLKYFVLYYGKKSKKKVIKVKSNVW